METSIETLRWTVFLLAPLVLVSYGAGFVRARSPADLWGGVDGRLKNAMTAGLGLAAVGFLTFGWLVLFGLDAAGRDGLRFPGQATGAGTHALLTAYLVYLIPSALWFEATLWYLRRPTALNKAATIGVLGLVSLGSCLLLLLGIMAWSRGVAEGPILTVAALLMAHQAVVMDSVFWVRRFPWQAQA